MEQNITSWITLFTVIAGFLFQAWRAERQRKWDVEDRKALADKVARDAKTVEDKVENVATNLINHSASIAKKVISDNEDASKERAKLLDAIKENTDISTQAFKEANTVNQKIEKLGISHNQIEKEKLDSRKQGR